MAQWRDVSQIAARLALVVLTALLLVLEQHVAAMRADLAATEAQSEATSRLCGWSLQESNPSP